MSKSLVEDLAVVVTVGTIGKDTGIEYVEGSCSHLYTTIAVLAKCGYRHGGMPLCVDFKHCFM